MCAVVKGARLAGFATEITMGQGLFELEPHLLYKTTVVERVSDTKNLTVKPRSLGTYRRRVFPSSAEKH